MRSKGTRLRQKKWLWAVVLGAAALFMYVSIIARVGSGG